MAVDSINMMLSLEESLPLGPTLLGKPEGAFKGGLSDDKLTDKDESSAYQENCKTVGQTCLSLLKVSIHALM